jgi:hypothetical protein
LYSFDDEKKRKISEAKRRRRRKKNIITTTQRDFFPVHILCDSYYRSAAIAPTIHRHVSHLLYYNNKLE